jgi:hypothetical protein
MKCPICSGLLGRTWIGEWIPVEAAEWKPIDARRGDLFAREEFIRAVEATALIDYDGFGEYATETEASNLVVKPSDIARGWFLDQFSHILWFNR